MTAIEPPINLAHNIQTSNDDTWINLNRSIAGNQEFWPVTIKAFYVFGLLNSILKSSEALFQTIDFRPGYNSPIRFLSVFAINASAIELLGRCLLGVDQISHASRLCLVSGFRWLFDIDIEDNDDDDAIMINTANYNYSINQMVNMRHFAAHGQSSNANIPQIFDPSLMSFFPKLWGDCMEKYWASLTNSPDEIFCQNMAVANINPIHLGNPIFATLFYFNSESAGKQFYDLDFEIDINNYMRPIA